MTEYYTVKRIDNSRLIRPAAKALWKDFWNRMAAGGAIAACLLFYAWQHFECMQVRYQLEQLDTQRAQATELNEQLRLEVATLGSPSRVDAIARNQLGLTVAAPGQATPLDGAADAVVAEARPAASAARP
jgi:cell division protein FtsL